MNLVHDILECLLQQIQQYVLQYFSHKFIEEGYKNLNFRLPSASGKQP